MGYSWIQQQQGLFLVGCPDSLFLLCTTGYERKGIYNTDTVQTTALSKEYVFEEIALYTRLYVYRRSGEVHVSV